MTPDGTESGLASRQKLARRVFSWPAIIAGIVMIALMAAMIPQQGTTAAGPPLYPDLRTPPPSNLYFEYGYDGIWRLRFANTVSNYGGPLEITVDGNNRIYQNVYDAYTGGNLVSTTRVGSDLIYHPTHNHFHFADFANYELLVKDSRGAFRRSPRQSNKTTFCILDYSRVNSPGPSSPQYTTCGASYQGLSAGWGDTYTSDLPDQWIQLGSSRLADGDYAIRSTADPYNKLRESNETNNQGILYFAVRNGQLQTVSPPAVCGVTPDAAPVGTLVTLSCERFGSSETVDIRWGGPSTEPIATVTSTANGAMSATVAVPEGGIGNHYFIATGRTSDTQVAAIFNTRPSVARHHWNRTVGSTTTIYLKGFSPGETVQVRFTVSPTSIPLLGTVSVNSMGSAGLLVVIPTSTFGRHDITATGLSSGQSAVTVINVNPSMTVAPLTVSSGGSLGISLRGFGRYENVSVTINGESAGQVRTSSTGSTTASTSKVTVPATLAEGTYSVVATGQTTSGSASASIEVSGVTLASEPTSTPATPEAEMTPVETTVPPDELTATPTSPASIPPLADAGPDQSVEDADGDGFAEVKLDGSHSYDSQGRALTVTWTVPDGDDDDLEPDQIGDEVIERVTLPSGVTVVTLTVTDPDGGIATDDIEVTVLAPASTTTPLESPGTPVAP